ncbi:MAG TPA: hypothetical protein VFV52_14910 [Bacilli bacterium]|nr:hypothetical protein [Bacilli bacterium]
MSTRPFFLGIGAGLIAATLVFAAGDALQPAPQPEATPQTPGQKTDESDWQEQAKQAGLLLLTQEQLDQKLAAAKQGAAPKQEPAKPTSIYVYILPGMGTNDVARLLQAAGVVEDGNRLIELRSEQEDPIRAGMYELQFKMDPADVLHKITTAPSE